MTPEVLLICSTLISNSPNDTTAMRVCTPQQAPLVQPASNSFERVSFRMLNDISTEAQAAKPLMAKPEVETIVDDTQPAASPRLRLPAPRMKGLHKARWHKYRVIPTATTADAPPQRRSFWDQLMDEHHLGLAKKLLPGG